MGERLSAPLPLSKVPGCAFKVPWEQPGLARSPWRSRPSHPCGERAGSRVSEPAEQQNPPARLRQRGHRGVEHGCPCRRHGFGCAKRCARLRVRLTPLRLANEGRAQSPFWVCITHGTWLGRCPCWKFELPVVLGARRLPPGPRRAGSGCPRGGGRPAPLALLERMMLITSNINHHEPAQHRHNRQ